MSQIGPAISTASSVLLRVCGEPITYFPGRGMSPSITENALLLKPEIDQSTAPGYFADLEVDPGTMRQRGDLVVWSDGSQYIVNKVVQRLNQNTVLAIHRTA